MAPPAGVLCVGCGLEFKYLEPPRENCFKCEKLDKCGGNATEMAAVEAPHKSSKDKENVGKTEQKAMSTSSSAVIEVVDDSDDLNNGSDSDIQEVQQQQMDILKSKLAQNKKASSSIRLTRKVKDESDEVPSATRNFLKLRETAKKRTDMSKSTQLLFKVTVNLQKPAGQKVGTCVPAQSRGFEFEDKMEYVLRTMVDMVQERGGRWEQIYPGKTFRRYFVDSHSPTSPLWAAITSHEVLTCAASCGSTMTVPAGLNMAALWRCMKTVLLGFARDSRWSWDGLCKDVIEILNSEASSGVRILEMTTPTQRNHSDMARCSHCVRDICEEWYKIQDPCFDSGNFEAHWISLSTKWDACYSQCQTGAKVQNSVAIRAKLGCGLIFDLFWSEGDTPVEGWDRSTWSCCMLAVTDFEGCSNTAQLIAQNNVKSWKCGRMRQFLEKLLGTMTFENFFRQIFGEIGLAVLKCRICDDALAMLQLFNQEVPASAPLYNRASVPLFSEGHHEVLRFVSGDMIFISEGTSYAWDEDHGASVDTTKLAMQHTVAPFSGKEATLTRYHTIGGCSGVLWMPAAAPDHISDHPLQESFRFETWKT
ncbi:hypothetical protein B0H14DRAFT_3764181 [Mycena olivaceomarginata]|nr:hypothetical protein B0H14DRAFT_3764181 [Mycena olivaceomarginata]